MTRLSFLALPAVLLALTAPPATGRNWTVLADGTGDAPSIQAGIDSAAAGDTVVVACGRYCEHDIEMRSGIALCSETRRSDCAVIDAGGQGRCFHCVDLDSTTSIVGFTLTGGIATGEGTDCHGGAMYCRHSSHHVAHCTFVDNRAACTGGGVFCDESSPAFTACLFHGNADGQGVRGLHCDRSSSPRIRGCEFRGESETIEGKHDGGSRKHHGHHGRH